MSFQNGGYFYRNYRMSEETANKLAKLKKRDFVTYEELFLRMIKLYECKTSIKKIRKNNLY